jgi:hypothetical protein
VDQPTGDDAQTIFDAIVKDSEARRLARGFDNTDHTGDNVPSPDQVRAAVDILRKARELRRLLRS